MHPLIQSYAKKIGRDRYDELLAMGEKLACIHFMLRLAKNANIYWSKDTQITPKRFRDWHYLFATPTYFIQT